MHELLALQRVALVGLVAHELVFVDHKEGLPDGCETVNGKGLAAVSDMGNEVPSISVCRTRQVSYCGNFRA